MLNLNYYITTYSCDLRLSFNVFLGLGPACAKRFGRDQKLLWCSSCKRKRACQFRKSEADKAEAGAAAQRVATVSEVATVSTVVEASTSFANDSGVSVDEPAQSWFLTQPSYNSDDDEFAMLKEQIKSDAVKQCVISDCVGSWSGGAKEKEEHYKRYHAHEAHRLPHRFMVRYFAKQAQIRDRRNAASRARTEAQRQKFAHLEVEKQKLLAEKAKKWAELDGRVDQNTKDVKELKDNSVEEKEKTAALQDENKKLKKAMKRVQLELALFKAKSGLACVKQEPEEPEVVTFQECALCKESFDGNAALEKHIDDTHSEIFRAI